jgi:hypothetical protein
MYMYSERNHVELVIEHFLSKWQSREKLVHVLDIGKGVPPSKPLGLEEDIHMYGHRFCSFSMVISVTKKMEK